MTKPQHDLMRVFLRNGLFFFFVFRCSWSRFRSTSVEHCSLLCSVVCLVGSDYIQWAFIICHQRQCSLRVVQLPLSAR